MSLKEEIIKESKIFVRQNHGLLIDTDGHYTSPRISSEFMDCSMPMTFDQYSHCSLGCLYCFAYAFKSNNPSFNSKLRAVNYEEMILSLEGKAKTARGKAMYRNFYKKRFVLHWGGLGDPFCNFEKANGIGYEIIEALGSEAYPTLFSFKGSAIFRTRYRKLFEKYSDQSNFAFQVSIITGNDSLGKVVEIGVPIPSRRIDAIRMLSEMGYYTILRLRPYIIGISEHGIDELLDRSLDAGIKAISMEFFAMDARANPGMKKRYKWLGNLIGTKDIDQYFKTLSPSKRGGYMRLNRKVKETHVKTVYDFCMKNDLVFACSDPDFKELNTSGSCFSANTEVVIKRDHSPYVIKRSLLSLYDSYNKFNTKLEVLCNGKWIKAKPIRINYAREWYRIYFRNGTNIITTDDHIHFTKDGEKLTKDLSIGDFMLFANKKIVGIDEHRGNYDLGRFVGLYLAEGSMALKKNKNRYKIRFSINRKARTSIDFLKPFANKMGGFWSINLDKRSKKCFQITIYSQTLTNLLREFISGTRAKNKYIKNNVLNMSLEFRKGILEGWCEGDGKYLSTGRYGGGSSSSKKMIDGMYEIAISLGLLPSKTMYRRKTGIKSINGKITNPPAKGILYGLGLHKTEIKNKGRRKIKYLTSKIYQQKFHKIRGKVYTQIIKIEKIGINRSKYAYCLLVNDGHRFQLANGIITHNCCGMPASFEGNKELENWTKNQLSYHIKEAKMRFDKTGKTYMFHFDRVFKPDEDTYLVDPAYMNDHIGVSGMSASERRVMTYLEFARNTWNNLNSPGNPRNYFHGKMLPINIDREGDLIYKYVPNEYENRWRK